MASKIKLNKNLLKDLTPLSSLSYDKLEELASKSVIEDLPAGRILFRQGERDNRILYLINGQVELTSNGDNRPQLIKAKTPDAKQPLSSEQPRPVTAKAKGPITLLTVDPDLLEIIMNDTPLNATELEVTEISADDTTDWMLRFLQSRAFLKLPTENIQAILMRMEELPAKKGEVIIRQGEKDDFYYIVQSGSCAVSRRPAPKAQDIPLATLTEGAGFGEEALITNGKRNATITMLEDGVLMRLNKKDFLEYLAAPLITRLNENDIINKISNGALLIDLRKHEEYAQQHVDGAVNIPLSMLRLKLEGLNPNREYVLACADGTQSAAAAFLLTQHGFNCSILDGGLNASNIKLTEKPKAPATVSAAPSSKRTMAAEKTQKAAEDRARKITQEADSARREAEQLAQQTATAERAKREAEKEIKRLQSIQQKQDQAEQADRKKAEQARRQAEQELQKIEAARQANEQKQQALDDSLKRARQIAAEASKAAEDSRKQAEKEAEEIRRKAHQEAQQLKQEMEETRRRFEQQASQAEEQKEAERQAAIEKARQEAEEIRRQAQSEAERLRTELEAAKQAVDDRAAKVEQEESGKRVSLLEDARQRAMELAEKTTRIAEQEAEEIRRKALEEAEQLRQEMEQTRKLVMEHAARAQQEADQQQRKTEQQLNTRQAEEQARHEAEQRAQRQAEEQAQRKAEEQARRQAEEQAQRKAEEQARRQAEEQAQREDAEREARRQQAIRNAKMKRTDHARRMAEEIKAKLEQAERQRQEEEERQRSNGFSVSRATIKRKDGKIILEGDEDIFIFKEPEVTPEQIESELARESATAVSSNELPSFEIEEPNKTVIKPVNTRAMHAKLAERHASHQQQRKKHHVFALAAMLLLALGGGGIYLFMHPELIGERMIAKPETGKKDTTAKASVGGSGITDKNQTKQKREKSLKSEARERFDALLKEWKEITSR